MSDDRATWIRHSWFLSCLTVGVHIVQFAAGAGLWVSTKSPALLAFGLDAVVSAFGSLLLTLRIRKSLETGVNIRPSRVVAYGYLAAATVTGFFGASQLWSGQRPERGIAGIVLAALSMLVIPIIGSYMKTLGVELRSNMLRSAAVFTFGNSYLSMVLLIALLLNTGMDFRWGDPLGSLVMFPFMAQKGFQLLVEEGKQEYVED